MKAETTAAFLLRSCADGLCQAGAGALLLRACRLYSSRCGGPLVRAFFGAFGVLGIRSACVAERDLCWV